MARIHGFLQNSTGNGFSHLVANFWPWFWDIDRAQNMLIFSSTNQGFFFNLFPEGIKSPHFYFLFIFFYPSMMLNMHVKTIWRGEVVVEWVKTFSFKRKENLGTKESQTVPVFAKITVLIKQFPPFSKQLKEFHLSLTVTTRVIIL